MSQNPTALRGDKLAALRKEQLFYLLLGFCLAFQADHQPQPYVRPKQFQKYVDRYLEQRNAPICWFYVAASAFGDNPYAPGCYVSETAASIAYHAVCLLYIYVQMGCSMRETEHSRLLSWKKTKNAQITLASRHRFPRNSWRKLKKSSQVGVIL